MLETRILAAITTWHLNSFAFDFVVDEGWRAASELLRPRGSSASTDRGPIADSDCLRLAIPRMSGHDSSFGFATCSVRTIAWRRMLGVTQSAERCDDAAIRRNLLRTSIWTRVSGPATWILEDCDHPGSDEQSTSPKGFWRVDKDKDPELRHTVLTLVAFADLEEKIRAAGGDREKGIEAFLNQNDGEGWMLPETLRLADYGLGHDERAKHPQPVASRLGPRFYDWQLAQTAEESWRECEIHAKNLQAAGLLSSEAGASRGHRRRQQTQRSTTRQAPTAGRERSVRAGRTGGRACMTADSCAVAIAGDAQVIEFVRSARERLIFVAPAVNQAVATAICEQAASLGEAAATVILDTIPRSTDWATASLVRYSCSKQPPIRLTSFSAANPVFACASSSPTHRTLDLRTDSATDRGGTEHRRRRQRHLPRARHPLRSNAI